MAQRSHYESGDDAREGALPRPDPADWLTLQQAACELGVSLTTARRLLRKGILRNRIVPRRGGFAYLVYLPGSRHASLDGDACRNDGREPHELRLLRPQDEPSVVPQEDARVQELEDQVESLSKALSRALRAQKAKSLPAGTGEPTRPDDPYGRYRWLARKKRWFGVPQLFSSASNAGVDRVRRIVAGDD